MPADRVVAGHLIRLLQSQLPVPEQLTIATDRPDTRANTGALGRKKPNRNGWALDKWWSWGDLNPRPQAIFEQIYMFSGLI